MIVLPNIRKIGNVVRVVHSESARIRQNLLSLIVSSGKTGILYSLKLSIIAAALFACSLSRPVTPLPAQTFTVATYNILYRNYDLAKTVEVIRSFDADLVCLQETNIESQAYIRQALASEYPYMSFYLSCIGNGPGVLSRYPIHNDRYQVSSYGINGYWFGEVQIDGQSVNVINVHLQPTFLNSNPFVFIKGLRATESVRKQEIREVFENVLPDKPTLIMGDFNSMYYFVAPRFLRKHGFSDSYGKTKNKRGIKDTLHFKYYGMNVGYRVDYIFHTGHMQTYESRIVEGEPSDHNPVVSILTWNNMAEAAMSGN